MDQLAPAPGTAGYNVAMGYLRATATVMVVLFHAVLAYYAWPFPWPDRVVRMSFPVIDSYVRFAGARTYAAYFDNYVMALMFFLSGLFVWPSLTRKGAGAYLRGRLLRLGLPFVFSAGLVGALAYYPTYLQSRAPPTSIGDYFRSFQTLGQWRSGAAWFIAILLLYDLAPAALYAASPALGARMAAFGEESRCPLKFLAIVLAVSAVAYVPLALAFGPFDWWNLGPFWLQKSRALLYPVYFMAGVCIGAYGLDRSLAARDGRLARGWLPWLIASLITFFISANVQRKFVSGPQPIHLWTDPRWGGLMDILWVLNCAVCTFAAVALFARFARPGRMMNSLSRNAYGIYLIHYALVSWSQYVLQTSPLKAPARAACVFAFALATSWLFTAALRRIPAVARII